MGAGSRGCTELVRRDLTHQIGAEERGGAYDETVGMVRVYLDQNFWIRLTAARLGRPGPGFAELLEACDSAIEACKARFVLSLANYEENWRRGSLTDRVAVAETMERLSAFETMRTVWRLHEDEVRASLCQILSVECAERPAVFGRGIRHLLPVEPFELFSADFQAQLAHHSYLREAVAAHIERVALVGSMFEGNEIEARRPDREHHAAYTRRRTELATNLRAAGNSPDLARRLILAEEFADMSPTITKIGTELGYAIQPTSRQDIESFLASLPMGAIVTALHVSAIRDGRAWTPNDYNDVLYLGAASAYCDVVAGERHWTAKLNHPAVPTRSKNVCTATDLVSILETLPD